MFYDRNSQEYEIQIVVRCLKSHHVHDQVKPELSKGSAHNKER